MKNTVTLEGKFNFRFNSAKAEVEVKTGDLTDKIIISKDTGEIKISEGAKLATLKSAGIELDFDNVIYGFEEELSKHEELTAKINEAKYSKAYEKEWWFGIADTIEDVKITKTDRETYISKKIKEPWYNPGITATYNGHDFIISYKNVSRDRWSNTKNMKYSFDDFNYKLRNYGSLKNACKKIKELVKEKRITDIEKQAKKIIKANKNKIITDKIKEICVNDWNLIEGFEWNKFSRESYKIFSLSKQNQATVKVYYSEDTKMFTIAGFRDLTKEKAIKLLELI